jgi:hypothetical protein
MATVRPVFNKTPANVTFYRGETAILPQYFKTQERLEKKRIKSFSHGKQIPT